MELMLFTCARSVHINTDRKVLNRDFPKLTSLSFSLRPSVLRHVMYTIVDRYDNERETWSKSSLDLVPSCASLLASTSYQCVHLKKLVKCLLV